MAGVQGLALIALISACFHESTAYKPIVYMHGILAAGNEADTIFKWIEEESNAYKPVLYMHGIYGGKPEADDIFKWVQEAHPSTITHSIDLYDGLRSTVNMMKQQADINAEVIKYMEQYPDGINLICYSQGGLLCRGVLQQTKHNVDTFIALSSPLAGQFGMTTFDPFFPNQTRDTVYKIAYTGTGQNTLSVCNYWNDPKQQGLYRRYSKYLAVLNNATNNPLSEEWKTNFLRLKNIVLIGGPNDGVITPWQSSQFGYYDDKLNVGNMTAQPFYINDMFGLQTLAKRDAVHVYTMEGVVHNTWYRTKAVFDKFILTHLT